MKFRICVEGTRVAYMSVYIGVCTVRKQRTEETGRTADCTILHNIRTARPAKAHTRKPKPEQRRAGVLLVNKNIYFTFQLSQAADHIC